MDNDAKIKELYKVNEAMMAKIGALEAVVIELARRAEMPVRDTDFLISKLGTQYSERVTIGLRKHVMQMLFRDS